MHRVCERYIRFDGDVIAISHPKLPVSTVLNMLEQLPELEGLDL
jgi:hypothetical protein